MKRLSVSDIDTKTLSAFTDKELTSVSEKVERLYKRYFGDSQIKPEVVLKARGLIAKEVAKRSKPTEKQKTVVQTLILSKTRFKSLKAAIKWVKDHNFKVPNPEIDETETSYRFRQLPPGRFVKGSFRTITLTEGVKAVVGRLKEKAKKKEKATVAKFLPIEKKKEDEQVILAVVLEPNTVDSQKDKVRPEVISDVAHTWLAKFQIRGLMHKETVNHKVEIYESYIAPANLTINGKKIKKGTWLLMLHIIDAQMWKDIKEKKLKGLSIGGTARRVPVKTKRLELEEVGLGKLAA